MTCGPVMEKVFVFEGASWDEMKAFITVYSTVETTTTWLPEEENHLQWRVHRESYHGGLRKDK